MQQSNLTSEHNEKKEKGFTLWFQNVTYYGLVFIGSVICLGLVYYSFFYTQFMKVAWVDMAEDKKDQPLWNVAAILVLCLCYLGFMFVRKRFAENGADAAKRGKAAEVIPLVLSAAWILAWGMIWIFSMDRVPEGDPAYIYGGASYFLEGDYKFLRHGCYCQLYPQQLGQIAIVELFFLLVGKYNYFAIQFACVFFAVGIHVVGYGILRELEAKSETRWLYCLLMMGCIPLICYTSWVYGDLPSVFFIYLFALLALKLRKEMKWQYAVGMVLSFTLAALVRKNSMICLVAFGILAVMDLVIKKRWRMVVVGVLSLLVSLLSYRAVYAVYEYQSGYQIGKGLPVNSWIGMGMEENWNGNGWYSNSPKDVGLDFDYEYDPTERYFASYIRGRLEEFCEDPGYAWTFYRKKVLSQWNGPLYQCIYFSKCFTEGKWPKAGGFLDRLYRNQEPYQKLLFWADRWQFLVFVGTLLFFLLKIRRDQEPMNLLFAVIVIGGFFFSILWEAKGRYCLPYYLMMYPLAVLGYEKLWEMLRRAIVRFSGLNHAE